MLISKNTHKEYIQYLRERDYDFFFVGDEHINMYKSLKILLEKYNIKTILTDSGSILSNLLLTQCLVDEISLLIHPVIVGDKSYNIFNYIKRMIPLKMIKNEILGEDYCWLVYMVIRD